MDDGVGRYIAPELPPDEPVEVGRYVDAFKRSRWLIAVIVVLVTTAVFLISLLLPKTYQATSKLALDPTAPSLPSSGDAQSTQRDLATVRVLLTTRELLAAAAKTGLAGRDSGLASQQGDRERRPGRERDQHRRHRRHGPRRGCDRQRGRSHVPGPRAALSSGSR